MDTDLHRPILSFGEVLWDLLPDGPALGGAPLNFAARMQAFGHPLKSFHESVRTLLVNRRCWESKSWDSPPPASKRTPISPQALWKFSWMPLGMPITTSSNQWPTMTSSSRTRQSSWSPGLKFFISKPGSALSESKADAETNRGNPSRGRHDRVRSQSQKRLLFKETIHASLEMAQWMKCNEEESRWVADTFELKANSLPERAVEILERWHLEGVVMTLGSKGALAVTCSGQIVYQPGFQVQALETIGAGDATTAAFVHHWLAKDPLPFCLRRGCALGSMVTTQHGATQSISMNELNQWIRTAPLQVMDPTLEPWCKNP